MPGTGCTSRRRARRHGGGGGGQGWAPDHPACVRVILLPVPAFSHRGDAGCCGRDICAKAGGRRGGGAGLGVLSLPHYGAVLDLHFLLIFWTFCD